LLSSLKSFAIETYLGKTKLEKFTYSKLEHSENIPPIYLRLLDENVLRSILIRASQ
jgi:hypothetical protein